MNKQRWLGILIAVLGILLSVLGSVGSYPIGSVYFLGDLKHIIISFSFALLLITSFSIVVIEMATLLSHFFRKSYNLHTVEPAIPLDFPGIVSVGRRLVSPDLNDNLMTLYSVNSDTIYVAKKIVYNGTENIRSKIVGYFIIVPLNKNGFELWRRGQLNGLNLSEHHIVRPNGRPYALCIVVVAGSDRISSGHLENRMITVIKKHLPSIKWIITRPITGPGRDAAVRYGFREIEAETQKPYDPLWGIEAENISTSRVAKFRNF